ncbi:MAG: hypothetical protein KatS3mg102_1034 [Planctomycetota bacterium]|nr:MAG: hypothetical protein KatS3mg102_1034 [Planctomycetota bacterium]
MGASFFIRCPGCKTEIEIDRHSGKVIRHGPAAGAPADPSRFEQVLGTVRSREGRGASAFDAAAAELQNRSRKLDDAFRQAVQKVRESDDGSRPFNPLELD